LKALALSGVVASEIINFYFWNGIAGKVAGRCPDAYEFRRVFLHVGQPSDNQPITNRSELGYPRDTYFRVEEW